MKKLLFSSLFLTFFLPLCGAKNHPSLIPVNPAEAILIPCWDSNMADVKRWEAFSSSGKSSVSYVFGAVRLTVRDHFRIRQKVSVQADSFDRLLVSILLEEGRTFVFRAETDAGLREQRFTVPKGDAVAEYALALGGAKEIRSVELEFDGSSAPMNPVLNWIGTADSAARRHEINHQLTALDCLYQNGRYKEMGKLLARMQADQASRSLFPFTGNRTVNTILQNAAGQARRWGVRFHAYADLPDDLPLPETDLCALLMNMLDNALEAAAKVGEGQKKYVRVQMKVNGSYLAIRCENAYPGEIRTRGDGDRLTKKPDRSVHGFGCRQMRQIAEKYESRLLFSFEDPHVFIVETALHIPENTH